MYEYTNKPKKEVRTLKAENNACTACSPYEILQTYRHREFGDEIMKNQSFENEAFPFVGASSVMQKNNRKQLGSHSIIQQQVIGDNTGNIIQCMPDLGEVATVRFCKICDKRKQKGWNARHIYNDIMKNRAVYGLPIRVINEIKKKYKNLAHVNPDAVSCNVPKSFLKLKSVVESVIKGYYNDVNEGGIQEGCDLNVALNDFNASLGSPSTPYTSLNVLKEALLSILFCETDKRPFYKFWGTTENYFFKDHAPLSPITPRVTHFGNFTSSTLKKKVEKAAKLASLVMGPRDVTVRSATDAERTDPDNAYTRADYWGEQKEIRVFPVTDGSRVLDVMHEMGHDFEEEMGVEDFVHVHRFLRARSKGDATFTDGSYLYDTHMPVIGPPGTDSAEQNGPIWNYASKVYGVDGKTGHPLPGTNPSFNTEFISTGMALFSKRKEAKSLIENDPQRAAFLLYMGSRTDVFVKVKDEYNRRKRKLKRKKKSGISLLEIEKIIHVR